MSLLDLVNKRAKRWGGDSGGLTEVPLSVRLMNSAYTLEMRQRVKIYKVMTIRDRSLRIQIVNELWPQDLIDLVS